MPPLEPPLGTDRQTDTRGMLYAYCYGHGQRDEAWNKTRQVLKKSCWSEFDRKFLVCRQVVGAAQVGTQSAGYVERREGAPATEISHHCRADTTRSGRQTCRVPGIQSQGRPYW